MATWSGGAPGTSGEWTGSGSFTATSTPRVGGSSGYSAGLRWASVPIPKNTTITSATLTFTVNTTSLTSGRNVGFHAVDNAPTLADSQQTTAFTATAATYTSGTGAKTVDVTAGLQALVNRAGWASGNAAVIRVEGVVSGAAPTISSISITVDYTGTHSVTVTVPAVSAVSPSPALLQPVDVTVPAVSGVGFTADLIGANFTVPAVSGVGFTATLFASGSVTVPAVSGVGFTPQARLRPTVTIPAVSGVALSPGRLQRVEVTVVAVSAVTVSVERFYPDPATPAEWQTLVASERFVNAITGRTPQATMSVEVLSADGSGVVLARFGGPHKRGPLAATRAGFEEIRVACSSDNGRPTWALNITSRDPTLLPGGPGAVSMLNPFEHNIVRAWWWLLVGEVWERIPVGTGTVDSVLATDDDMGFVVTIVVRDLLADVARAKWDETLSLGGLPVSEAIGRVLLSRAPWVSASVPPSRERLPDDWAHGQPDSDPTDDLARLAEAMGGVARTTRMGEFIVDPVQHRSSAVVRARIVEGVTGGGVTQLLGVQSTVTDMDQVVNACTVTSASPSVDPPVSGRFEITDPASPIRVDVRRYSRAISNAIITSEAQAATMARNYVESASAQLQMTVTHSPRPDLSPGDVVEIALAEAGVWGRWTVEGWTLDSATGPQTTTVVTERAFA